MIEQQIRDTAYFLWEADGRPEGQSDKYWAEAESVVREQMDREASEVLIIGDDSQEIVFEESKPSYPPVFFIDENCCGYPTARPEPIRRAAKRSGGFIDRVARLFS